MAADLLKPDPAPTIPTLALRLKDAAKALNVSDRTLWGWADAKLIPCIRINGTVLFSVDALRTWCIEQSKTVAPAEGATK